MNLSAWIQEQSDITRWGFNEWLGRRYSERQIAKERVRGATAERIGELRSQQEKASASYQEYGEVVRSDRLLRQARQKRVPVPASDDAASWLAPKHGTQTRLSPSAYDDLRTRLHRDRYALWAFVVSVVSLCVAALAYLKQP